MTSLDIVVVLLGVFYLGTLSLCSFEVDTNQIKQTDKKVDKESFAWAVVMVVV